MLLGFLAHHQRKMSQQGGSVSGPDDWAGAMVLSVGASSAFPDLDNNGLADRVQEPADRIPMSYLTQMAVETDAPVLVTNLGTLDALERIKTFTAKHNINDTSRESRIHQSWRYLCANCTFFYLFETTRF